MLDESTLPLLTRGRNLLAFSAGVDSTALFYLLLHAGIPFDIAHVNYRTRPQSDAEAAHARSLAQQHGKRCYGFEAPPIKKNFEAQARKIRYDFFASVIHAHAYDVLLTAHQLDDRLEWLLMQLCKGAGLPEMLGMSPITQRENYALVRPLLRISKGALQSWLDREGYTYFVDDSNTDPRHLRNRFRRAAVPMIAACPEGIAKSFEFLSRDAQLLADGEQPAIEKEILMLPMPKERLELMRRVDRWLKKKGYLLRRGEKERMQTEDELILGRRFALSVSSQCVLLTPHASSVMPKAFKENCRRLGIGKKVRPFLFEQPAIFKAVRGQLLAWRDEA